MATILGITAAQLANDYPAIVTSGLIINLDAANINSYTGTGTKWYDLTNNNNDVTLVSSPIYNSGGYFTFNGTTQYAISDSTSLLGGTGNIAHSVEMWVNFSVIDNIYRWWLSEIGPYTTGSHHWIGTSGTSTQFGVYAGGQTSPILSGINNWQHIVSTHDGTNYKVYVNSILKGTTSATFGFTSSQWNIGKPQGAEGYFNGKISIGRIYNRAITDVEVTQNYNALKSRYGL